MIHRLAPEDARRVRLSHATVARILAESTQAVADAEGLHRLVVQDIAARYGLDASRSWRLLDDGTVTYEAIA